jgi:hypothetical protein
MFDDDERVAVVRTFLLILIGFVFTARPEIGS